MTLVRKSVGESYLVTESGEDPRPQLVSRHSSSLPIAHTKNTKKILSRRSRSVSPCVKKTQSSYSGNTVVPQQKRKITKEVLSNSIQLPVIKKQASQTLGKVHKAPRSSISSTKQRVQVLSDHRKLKIPSVWEHICAAQGDTALTDVNSNLTYNGEERFRYGRSHKPPCGFGKTLLCEEDDTADGIRHPETAATKSIFDILPVECKLKIFSYLNQTERGRCMSVSKAWQYLARTRQLWTNINLREFILCYGHDLIDSCEPQVSDIEEDVSVYQCTKQCYKRYMEKMDRYILFLIDVQPQVKRIAISFDFANDNWIERVQHLFRFVNFTQLTYADIDWHVTPIKPMWLVEGPTFQFKDVAYATRRRERFFLNFLDEFVTEMPRLKSLIVPFGWSQRAMRHLSTLPSLNCLILKKYTVFCTPNQQVFDELARMKRLEKLLIEVWMSIKSAHGYTISSTSLKYLDLSQCRGFYLQHVDLPSLEILKVERNNGIFKNQATIPCLYDILYRGAPKLKRINNANLECMDRLGVEQLFNCLCPCKKHHLN